MRLSSLPRRIGRALVAAALALWASVQAAWSALRSYGRWTRANPTAKKTTPPPRAPSPSELAQSPASATHAASLTPSRAQLDLDAEPTQVAVGVAKPPMRRQSGRAARAGEAKGGTAPTAASARPLPPLPVPPLPPKPAHAVASSSLGHDGALRPYELLGTSVLVGRQPSLIEPERSRRAAFAGPTLSGSALRSAHGRVRERLLVHAFSLQHTPFEGSHLRDTLREFAEQMQAFVERARPEQQVAQERVRALMPQLLAAMRVAELALEGGSSEALLAFVCEELRRSGVVLLPVEACDESAELGTDAFGLPRRRDAHAVLACVQSAPEGRYAAQVYNTGAGVVAHADACGTLRASFEVRNLPTDDRSLRRYLGELLQLYRHGVDLPSRLDTLYRQLAAWGTRVPAQDGAVKPQRTGNCAWKCVAAYLRANLDEVSYRSFKVFVRSRILYDFLYDTTPMDRPVSLSGVVGQAFPSAAGRRGRARRVGRAKLAQPPHARTSRAALVTQANARLARDVARLYRALRAPPDAGARAHYAAQALLLTIDAELVTTHTAEQNAANFDVVRFVEAQRRRSLVHADGLVARELAASSAGEAQAVAMPSVR